MENSVKFLLATWIPDRNSRIWAVARKFEQKAHSLNSHCEKLREVLKKRVFSAYHKKGDVNQERHDRHPCQVSFNHVQVLQVKECAQNKETRGGSSSRDQQQRLPVIVSG